ncbi:MAG: hypothetical protein CUN55_05175 [Phototrophicales bacterium]|nr:MAG: hypothetical protein CUN55_05175 [Phototrophicales bacterium]
MDAQTLAERKEKYQAIAKILSEKYGYPTWRQHLPPVDELVSTILSQSTTDANRDRGFYALKAKYADWESVRDAPLEEIVEVIRPAGLANQKGPRIQEALRYISEQVGEISLDFLKDMPIEEAKQWLTKINGIGPKTAAIILLFSFNMPAFPVDTHVHRVTKRLGLIDSKTNADKAHTILEAIVPPEDYYAVHLNFIQHGREICKARNPLCQQCPLTVYCQYYQEVVKQNE